MGARRCGIISFAMDQLSSIETKLYQLLIAFFGRDQVIPLMRVVAVCGGTMPVAAASPGILNCPDLVLWGASNRALFTIVDQQDHPRMVVEIAGATGAVIDAESIEHQRVLAVVLSVIGVRYLLVQESEIHEMLDPNSSLDLFSLLKDSIEFDDPVTVCHESE